jgi:competence protein ComEC
VLAASGMNVALISVFFLFAGKLLRLPLRVNLVIAMAGVALYALMTGLPPSVQRAGLMLEIAFVLKFINRSLRAVTLISITGVLLTLLNPMIVGMAGFQLSFLSTLGIMVMVPPLQEKLGFYITDWLAELLLVPLVAQLWVTPVLAYTFHQVPLFSLPANIISMPLVALLTYAGFLMGAVSLVLPNISHVFISWLWFPLVALNAVASFFSNLRFSLWHVYAFSWSSTLIFFGLLVLGAYHVRFPTRLPFHIFWKAVLAGLLVMVIPMGIAKFHDSQETRITWIPDGPYTPIQVVELPHKTVLLNVTTLKPWTARLISRYLQQHEVTHIALLNITNPNIKHLEGLEALLAVLPIDQVTFPKSLRPELLNQLVAWGENTHIPLVSVESTSVALGHGVQTLLYHQIPEDTLARMEIGPVCLASYQGLGELKDSPLFPLTAGCQMIEAQGRLLMKVNGRQARIALNQFHQVRLLGRRLWLD